MWCNLIGPRPVLWSSYDNSDKFTEYTPRRYIQQELFRCYIYQPTTQASLFSVHVGCLLLFQTAEKDRKDNPIRV
jgi:hypothetical protein